jgi:dinuclear metal center YbgI/SA1388 family protein
MPATLADVTALLDEAYPPEQAQSWDAVGLICGDPRAPVSKALLAVDPVAAVGEEAIAWGAQLIVTHHPLLLRPVHGVGAVTPKGRLVHRLITHGVGLFNAHTNADVATPGVSDALARAVGLTGPYLPLGTDGLGRIGTLPDGPPLRKFLAAVRAGLPRTPTGLRVAGDLDRPLRAVAVCGGAGDSLLDTARMAGVDAYLTADLRHHPASEFREHGDVALIDAPHWATEWPWLADVAALLEETSVETHISTIVTDAWTLALPEGSH